MRKTSILILVFILVFVVCDKGVENPYAHGWQSSTNGNGRNMAEAELEETHPLAEIRLDTDPCPFPTGWNPDGQYYWARFDIVIREFGGYAGVHLHKIELTFHQVDGSVISWNWHDLFLNPMSIPSGTPGEVRLPGVYQLYQRFDVVFVTLMATDELGRSMNSQWIIYSWYENPVCYY